MINYFLSNVSVLLVLHNIYFKRMTWKLRKDLGDHQVKQPPKYFYLFSSFINLSIARRAVLEYSFISDSHYPFNAERQAGKLWIPTL